MAKQTINIGTSANDGTGDPLRDAFDKCNDNFTELYDDLASLSGSTVTVESFMRTGILTATGTTGERVDFSSEFVSGSLYKIILWGNNDLGIVITGQDSTGFDFNSLDSGEMAYTALLIV